ncbi:glycerate kinase [Dehalococcoidia bacterium]|nr:glycerate kinase [Dehalococcoidia bacterium]MCL0090438.1 glycerate kinase [Dehalococcoidia bacterium]
MKEGVTFNKEELLRDERMQRERADVLDILAAALEAVDPAKLIKRHVRLEGDQLITGEKTYDLKRYQKIFVVGGGKASGALVPALEEILGEYITAGTVNTKYGYTAETEIIKINEAGHPIPDRNGVRGMEEVQRLLSIAGEGDLVICLISGGGSALLPLPAPGIGLEEIGRVTDLLLKAGAPIDQLNTVRKHISSVKGGQLARMAYPAELVSIILSDVVGDPLSTIASGPTVPDPTTFADAQRVLQRYDLWDEVPKLKERITRGIGGEIPETPKEGDPIFSHVYNFIIGNNRLAVEAAIERARERGFNTMLLSTFLAEEAREVGKLFAAIAREILKSGHPIRRKALVVAGGETTVTVRGGGKGGRNQELALSAAIAIGGLENVVIASLATDGTDGPTDGAGGLVDGYTVDRGRERGLDPIKHLDDNDSYNLLRQTGDLIVTGPTNTNVNDLVIATIF